MCFNEANSEWKTKTIWLSKRIMVYIYIFSPVNRNWHEIIIFSTSSLYHFRLHKFDWPCDRREGIDRNQKFFMNDSAAFQNETSVTTHGNPVMNDRYTQGSRAVADCGPWCTTGYVCQQPGCRFEVQWFFTWWREMPPTVSEKFRPSCWCRPTS